MILKTEQDSEQRTHERLIRIEQAANAEVFCCDLKQGDRSEIVGLTAGLDLQRKVSSEREIPGALRSIAIEIAGKLYRAADRVQKAIAAETRR